MTCHACTEAERDPVRDEFSPGCISCDARALAIVAVATSQDTLRKVFGDQQARGLEMVREWARKLRRAK